MMGALFLCLDEALKKPPRIAEANELYAFIILLRAGSSREYQDTL